MSKPIVLKVNPKRPEIEVIMKAANVVKSGGVIVYPTDTVYGLGADPLNERAVLRVFKVKERSLSKPLPVLISNLHVGRSFGEFNDRALKLAKRFWPGPLTIVVRKKEHIPSIITGGREGIGLRIPNYKVTLKLIELCGGAIIGTSANKSGFKASKSAEEALRILNGKVDLILDAGPSPGGVPSTIVDITQDVVKITRIGPISPQEIEKTLGETVEVIPKPPRAKRE